MTVKGEKSLACDTSKVRIKLARRSAANRSGLRSMHTFLAISKKKNRHIIRSANLKNYENYLIGNQLEILEQHVELEASF